MKLTAKTALSTVGGEAEIDLWIVALAGGFLFFRHDGRDSVALSSLLSAP